MYRDYQLETDADFDNALLFQLNVIVWQQGEIIDGGKVERFTDTSVRINEANFFRFACEFKVC
jgi:hypothetical protein